MIDAFEHLRPGIAACFNTDSGDPEFLYHRADRTFWVRDAHTQSALVPFAPPEFRKHLIEFHALPGYRDAEKGQKLAPVDSEIQRVIREQRVDLAMNLSGYDAGVHQLPDGRRVLVPREPERIAPQEGSWPFIEEILKRTLTGITADGQAIDQRPQFLAWLAHAARSFALPEANAGLALILAGPRDRGKSLLATGLVLPLLGGAVGSPFESLSGSDRFDGELAENALWLVDDDAFDSSNKHRAAYGKRIKAVVATEHFAFRGLYASRVTLRTFRRLLICCNDDPESLLVLPPLDDDISDKTMLLQVYPGLYQDPVPEPVAGGREAIGAALAAELPAFCHYLLYEHRTPEELADRFGAAAWHHPDLAANLFETDPAARLLGVIDRTIFPRVDGGPWTGFVAELEAELADQDVHRGNYLGRDLRKLSDRWPDRFAWKRDRPSGGRIRWTIQPPVTA